MARSEDGCKPSLVARAVIVRRPCARTIRHPRFTKDASLWCVPLRTLTRADEPTGSRIRIDHAHVHGASPRIEREGEEPVFHATSSSPSERTAAEDLSGPPTGGRKTCPVPGEGPAKDLCGGRGPAGPDRALPAPASCPARRNAAGQRGISVAEADGNRTRRRAFARPPILKACPTLALPTGL